MGALTGWLHEAFHVRETRAYRVTQSLVWILILISILLLGLESILLEDRRAAEVVAWADQFLLTIFAIEILLRVGTFRPPALDVFKRPPLGHLHAMLPHQSTHPLFGGAQPGKTQFRPDLTTAFPVKGRGGQNTTDLGGPTPRLRTAPDDRVCAAGSLSGGPGRNAWRCAYTVERATCQIRQTRCSP